VRAVVQVVDGASVETEGSVVGAIQGEGLLVLLGVTHGDGAAQARRMAAKVWGLRVLSEERSASDLGAPVLVVSQFTLYADTSRGRRPGWSAAAPGPVAEPVVTEFCAALRELGAHVETGAFGAHMRVSLVNDGPCTLVLDL
jgi:D-tyrosyl-tRNA(Tyr) deacylase